MRALLLLVVVMFAVQVTCAPARVNVERLPLTHVELHDLETQARVAHPDTGTTLTARDLHPETPILLAHLDESIPAFIVEREQVANMAELDDAYETDMDADDVAADQDETAADEDDDDDALVESDFEISAPYGYGGFGGGFGGYGGFGGGYGGKKVPYKKVPYKKVPYKKVPVKKAPPKKKLPPKKPPPKKKGKGGFGFGKKGGFGYGGGFGGHFH